MPKLANFLLLSVIFNTPIVMLAIDRGPSRADLAGAATLLSFFNKPVLGHDLDPAGRGSALAGDVDRSSPVDSVGSESNTGAEIFVAPVSGVKRAHAGIIAPEGAHAAPIPVTHSHKRARSAEAAAPAEASAAPIARTIVRKTGNPVKRHGIKHFCSNPDCKKGFRFPSEVRKHERLHNNERPCVCPHCLASFAHDSNLKRHLKNPAACTWRTQSKMA